jgi:hypothetical protein
VVMSPEPPANFNIERDIPRRTVAATSAASDGRDAPGRKRGAKESIARVTFRMGRVFPDYRWLSRSEDQLARHSQTDTRLAPVANSIELASQTACPMPTSRRRKMLAVAHDRS